MNCPRCGTEVSQGQRFCTECGAPMIGPDAQQDQQVNNERYVDDPGQPAVKKKEKSPNTTLIVIAAVLVALVFIVIVAALVVRSTIKSYQAASEKVVENYKKDLDLGVDIPDIDIDLDKINKAAKEIEDLDITEELGGDIETDEPDDDEDAAAEGLTKYSYVDVTRNGNDITVVPNGGLNGKTVLANGKDLNGFLDYVDNTVLEEGRRINREFFYEILAIMLVDESYCSDFDDVKSNMMMALAMANNFHNTEVTIKDCHLDANNAAEYRYNVKAYGTDDTWIVNYGKRTVFFNSGATEYTSTMFKDEYLAVWMVAIDEYYGKD